MATGYTADLEKDWDIKRWFKETLVRAFGVTVCIRDEPMGLNSEQIIEQACKVDTWHDDQLEKCKQDKARLLALSNEEWQSRFDERNRLAIRQYEERKREKEEDKLKYKDALVKIDKLEFKSELGNGVKKFALEQLGMVKSDFEEEVGGPYTYKTLKEFKDSELNIVDSSMKYHKESAAKEREEKAKRKLILLDFCREVDKVLDSIESPVRKLQLD